MERGVEMILILSEKHDRHSAFSSKYSRRTLTFATAQEPLSKTPDFYAANDRMTETLRGPLLTAQREISALDIRRRVILDKVSKTEQSEKTAYVAATNWQDTLANTAKKAGFVSHHAKLKTELSMVDVQIKDFKQVFGLEMFATLVQLEDSEGWLPTVRDIRSIYDQARRDVEKIQVRQKEKEAELVKLGGSPIVQSEATVDPSQADTDTSRPSYFKQIAAAEGVPPTSSAMTAPTAMHSVVGGPLSYSVPLAPPPTPAVPAAQPHQYPDPFSLVPPSQPPAYNAGVDPFAPTTNAASSYAMNPPPQSIPVHDPFRSVKGAPPQLGMHDPFPPMGGSSMNGGMGGSSMNGGSVPRMHDPFPPMGGSSMNGGSVPRMHDPFPPLGGGSAPPMHDPFVAAAPMASYDPFADLANPSASSQPPPLYGSTTQPPAHDNPLFRF
jgi:hypothetical protein